MAQGRPVSALEIKREVEGYSDMNDDASALFFYADRAELESLGIQLGVEKPGKGFFEAELYSLPPENFYLDAIKFSDDELAALSTALSLLTDGGFAYAEPLRLALQQVAWGHPNPINETDRAPVEMAMTASAGGRDLSQRLSKIETAISRRKTIEFTYYTMERDETAKRKVDPFHLVFRGGQFYLSRTGSAPPIPTPTRIAAPRAPIARRNPTSCCRSPPQFVTFMQHGPRKGVSKAISRRISVEHWRRAGYGEACERDIPGRGRVEALRATAKIRSQSGIGADHLRFLGSRAAGDSKVRRKPTPIMSTGGQHMTLIKSTLLGSAAGIVAVAGAQAADLPTHKAAPVANMSESATSAASPAGFCRAPTPA